MSSLRGLLKGLAKASKLSNKVAPNEISVILKKTKTGIPSVDFLFHTATITRGDSGVILINNTPANLVYDFVRKGDLVGLVRTLKSATLVTIDQTDAFRKIASAFPEAKLSELDGLINQAKTAWPDLDVTLDQLTNIPRSTQSQLANMTKKLYKQIPKGTKVALVFGGFVMGANWLTEATAARRGCFMFKNISGKMESCRIDDFSCSIGPRDRVITMPDLCQPRNYEFLYNVTLVLMAACQNDKPNQSSQIIARALNMQDIAGKFEEIYEDENKYLLATQAIIALAKDGNLPKFKICDLKHPAVDRGVVLPCRMCDSSADPKSAAFIDPLQFANSNIAFRCNPNPSILDTIVDIMQTRGVNLLEGVESTIWAILKPFALIGLAVLFALFIIGIILRFLKRKSEDLIALEDTNNSALLDVM